MAIHDARESVQHLWEHYGIVGLVSGVLVFIAVWFGQFWVQYGSQCESGYPYLEQDAISHIWSVTCGGQVVEPFTSPGAFVAVPIFLGLFGGVGIGWLWKNRHGGAE